MDLFNRVKQGVSRLGDFVTGIKSHFDGSAYQLEQQKQLADYQYQLQNEQIAKQNEYNSPAAQMARYREAGLNENLIYGQGSSGNQSSIASYQAPQVSRPDAIKLGGVSALNSILDLASKVKLFNVNIAKGKAEADKSLSDAIKSEQEGESVRLRNTMDMFNLYGEDGLAWDQMGVAVPTESSFFRRGKEADLTEQGVRISKYQADKARTEADTKIKKYLLTGEGALPGSTYQRQNEELGRKQNMYNAIQGIPKPDGMSEGLWKLLQSITYGFISGKGD